MSSSEGHELADARFASRRLGFAALGLLLVALVAAARRSSDLDELTIPELPGMVGWLFLAALASATRPAGQPSAPHRGMTSAALVWLPIAAAYAHTLAWAVGDDVRLAASVLAIVAAVGFLAAWVAERSRSGRLDVTQFGSLVAIVLVVGNLVLEVIESLVDTSSTPDVLDAMAPGLGVIAVVTGMTLVETGLRATPRAFVGEAAGTFQFALAGVGWAALVAGSALDDPSLLVTSVGLHLLATITFLVRLAPLLVPAVTARRWARWSALALISTAVYVGLLVHVVVGFADGRYADAAAFPLWLEIAVDMTSFLGLAASGLIGAMARIGRHDLVVSRLAFTLFAIGMIAMVLVGAAQRMPTVAALSFGMLGIAVAIVAWATTSGSNEEVAERPWRRGATGALR